MRLETVPCRTLHDKRSSSCSPNEIANYKKPRYGDIHQGRQVVEWCDFK